MIDFYEISSSNEVPQTLTEVGSSGPSGSAPKRVLIIAPRHPSGGSVAADVPYLCSGETSGDAGSGTGSPVGECVRAYREIDPDSLLYAVGIADDGSGVAAAGSIGLSGTASASGELVFRCGGRRYALGVASGDAAAGLLTSLKALIDADTRRQATTGTIAGGAIPLTSRFKGAEANYLDLRQEGAAVAGITVTLVAFASGATNGAITSAVAAVAAERYDTIVLGFSDATSVAAMETEATRRGQGGVEMPTMVFVGVNGSHSTAVSYGNGRNNKHTCLMPRGGSGTSPWVAAAMAAAAATKSFAADPGRPYWGLELPNMHAPEVADRWETTERNQAIQAGLASWDVNADGKVFLERLVTAYKTDASAQPDKKFQDVASMRILADWRERWRAATSGMRTWKLVDDDTPLAPGVKALTPSFGKTFQDGLYEEYAKTGNVQGVAEFKARSRCERDWSPSNPNGNRKRLNFYQPVRIGDFVVTLANRIEVV